MYGDFSRDSFDPSKHYTRVLMQQGRPLMDADWNELVSVLTREHRKLVFQIVGSYGTSDGGFELALDPQSSITTLAMGTYFADGLLCVNPSAQQRTKTDLRDFLSQSTTATGSRLVFIDAREDVVFPAQDKGMAEPALMGIDPSLRVRVRWTVRVADVPMRTNALTGGNGSHDSRAYLYSDIFGADVGPCALQRPSLQAQSLTVSSAPVGACAASDPQSIGSQSENVLYRIEVNRSGTPMKAGGDPNQSPATFKWSRTNCSQLIP